VSEPDAIVSRMNLTRSESDRAATFITAVMWRFAKTMPQWPHEYTVKAWQPELTEEFEALCRLIMTTGVCRPWPEDSANPRYRNHYLVIGAHEYWALGPHGEKDPPEGMTVINRQALP